MHTQKRIDELVKKLFATLDESKIEYSDELLANVVNDIYRTATCDLINKDTRPTSIIKTTAINLSEVFPKAKVSMPWVSDTRDSPDKEGYYPATLLVYNRDMSTSELEVTSKESK